MHLAKGKQGAGQPGDRTPTGRQILGATQHPGRGQDGLWGGAWGRCGRGPLAGAAGWTSR